MAPQRICSFDCVTPTLHKSRGSVTKEKEKLKTKFEGLDSLTNVYVCETLRTFLWLCSRPHASDANSNFPQADHSCPRVASRLTERIADRPIPLTNWLLFITRVIELSRSFSTIYPIQETRSVWLFPVSLSPFHVVSFMLKSRGHFVQTYVDHLLTSHAGDRWVNCFLLPLSHISIHIYTSIYAPTSTHISIIRYIHTSIYMHTYISSPILPCQGSIV